MAFEFLSRLDGKDSDQGLCFYEFESQIGNKKYDRSVISTCFPLFMQLNEKDFSDLQRNKYINNVLSLDDFIKECEREREESGLDSNLSNEILAQDLEEDFLFECQNDDNGLKFQVKMISVPIENPLKEYGVKNIGISDIFVEGRYNKHFFRNVWIADGFFRKENIFGMDFIESFSKLTFGKYDNYQSVYGFIE